MLTSRTRILDKINKNGKFIPPSPSPQKNRGWENGAFWLLHGFIFDIHVGGEWGFAVPVILSKIVGTSETKSRNNVDETFSLVFSFVSFLGINNCI